MCHRYLERIWRKSCTHLNRSRYTKQSHFCNRLMNKTKSDFYRNMISNNSDNPRQLWNCINRTLHRKASVSLPAHDSTNSLCNYFPKHFKDKISQFLLLVVVLIFQLFNPCTVFKPASITGVAKLILSSPNRSCELYHIPTFLLKSCLHTLIVPITKIINLSISSGVFPPHFKPAHVILLLTKQSLPVMDLFLIYHSYIKY